MLFNSLAFLIFFPIVTALYFLVPHSFRWIILLLASCIFYSFLIPAYLLILLLLIIIDYTAGILIEEKKNKKIFLILSLVANLTLLGVFKYYDFFVSNINSLTGANLILVHWVLPIGLSFHTFQSLSYTIEIFKGRQKAVRHLGYYALYVMYYPQLVAGPIERPQNMFPQFFSVKKFSPSKLYEGLRLMSWGFFKKLVIADRIGMFSDGIFNNLSHANLYSFLLGLFFFSIQIYADFSAYSDIAIGASRCMGIDLMINFDRPYFATNISQFWKRWHISLSSWFKDYIYIPLGGNRVSNRRHYFNLMLTFILSGFWHGAGWTFLIWGFLHGIYIILYEKWFYKLNLPSFINWLFTILLIGFAWTFFRINNIEDFKLIFYFFNHLPPFSFRTMINADGVLFGNFMCMLSMLFISYMFITEACTDPRMVSLNKNEVTDISFISLNLILIIFFGVFNHSNFIYFQF